MSRATTSGPESDTRVCTGSVESWARICVHRPVEVDLARRRPAGRSADVSGRKRAGSGSSCSRKTPSGVILALAWRSAEHDTAMPTGSDAPCRGSRITRTSWQKYLPPNCAPMPNCRVELQHLLLEVAVAEGVAQLRARGRQRVEVARRRQLGHLERVLRGHPADDDGQVVGRAGRGAQRAQLLVEERRQPPRVQQRLRLLVEEGLVGRAAALGQHQELVLRRLAPARSTARPGRAGWCRCCARPRTTWAPSASSAG